MLFSLAACSSPVFAQQVDLYGTQVLDGPSASVSGGRVFIAVAGGGDADITVVNGASLAGEEFIQIGNAGRLGTVRVAGEASRLAAGTIRIGALGASSGPSRLVVENDARVEAADFRVGGAATGGGELILQSGGGVTISNEFVVGYASPGVATVQGVGTSVSGTNLLRVGRIAGADGLFTVQDGAQISAGRAVIGQDGRGQLGLTGDGTALRLANQLEIGASASAAATSDGALMVADGALLEVGTHADIGLTTTGALTVSGTGQARIGGSLSVGTSAGARGRVALSDRALLNAGEVRFGDGDGALEVTTGAVLEAGQVAGGGGAASVLRLDGGTLRLTRDQPSLFDGLVAGAVELGAAGGTIDTGDFEVATAGGISGAGTLDKAGTGRLTLGVPATLTGDTVVRAGTLAAGGAGHLSAASLHQVQPGAVLSLGGFDQTVAALQNAGVVELGGPGGTTLTVTGDYVGEGGSLHFGTALGDDASATDRMVAANTSGTGTVVVRAVGGTGAQTVEGIKLIEVTGVSAARFTLQGDYLHDGEPVRVSGAYGYRLYQGGVSTPDDGDWYLRSSLTDPGDPPAPGGPVDPAAPGAAVDSSTPLYQAGAPLYEAYPQTLLALNAMPTLQQRGNRFWTQPVRRIEGTGFWGRIDGQHLRARPRTSTSAAAWDIELAKLQLGADGLLYQDGGGRLIGGIGVHYGHASAGIKSPHGQGRVSVEGYGVAATLTWYGHDGFYVDGQLQASRYDGGLRSTTSGTRHAGGNDGLGYALSLETGKRIRTDPVWSYTPQAQLVYSSVDFKRFTDGFGTRVSLRGAESLQARLGVAVERELSQRDGGDRRNRSWLYGVANLYYEFLDGTAVDVAGTRFRSADGRVWAGLGIGGSINRNNDRYAVFGELSVNTRLGHVGDSYRFKGTVGVRFRW